MGVGVEWVGPALSLWRCCCATARRNSLSFSSPPHPQCLPQSTHLLGQFRVDARRHGERHLFFVFVVSLVV
jgi:hypothetical protein